MYDELIQKINRIKPTGLTDEELTGFITEAIEKTCEDSYDKNSGVYKEDLLLYYVLGQLALYSGDLAEYSNYCILYNNAAKAFHRVSFEQSPPIYGDGKYRGLW
ncbi:MAG: hypothetical protein IJD11_03450 [Oscillospiraceae bacterium]|nr:hypothetical protein [Oscillospiraceae bacterium]